MSRKRCYYEIMGLTMDASDEDVKKSYRQLALALHPDKNPDNIEQANHQFKLLQEAYDVLSDPIERKWYDKHKDSILCGRNRDDIVDEGIDIYQYFSSSCYNSFSDEENGFYSVYRNLFNTIIQEDNPYRDAEDSETPPPFGHSKTDYSDVHRFYSYWMSYCTPKTYFWLNKYDINDAPNRRVARIIEKENKKVRDAAKKKRNEEIRQLVEFVRKRDKRVLENKKRLEAKAEANKKKAELKRRQHIEARNKELENYQESEWTSMAALEEELRIIEQDLDSNEQKKQSKKDSNDSEEEEEEAENSLYCIACDKTFKSDKAFANHENSKKHKTNVNFLKQELENQFNQANA